MHFRPAKLSLVFAKRVLVLKVQLSTALSVEGAKHFNENILQDCWA